MFVDKQRLKILYPSIKADITLNKKIKPIQDVFGTPIVAIAGQDDTAHSVEEVRAWEEELSSEFTLKVIPGGHHYLREPEGKNMLLEELNSILFDSIS